MPFFKNVISVSPIKHHNPDKDLNFWAKLHLLKRIIRNQITTIQVKSQEGELQEKESKDPRDQVLISEVGEGWITSKF